MFARFLFFFGCQASHEPVIFSFVVRQQKRVKFLPTTSEKLIKSAAVASKTPFYMLFHRDSTAFRPSLFWFKVQAICRSIWPRKRFIIDCFEKLSGNVFFFYSLSNFLLFYFSFLPSASKAEQISCNAAIILTLRTNKFDAIQILLLHLEVPKRGKREKKFEFASQKAIFMDTFCLTQSDVNLKLHKKKEEFFQLWTDLSSFIFSRRFRMRASHL
jgi:hypothetical protein